MWYEVDAGITAVSAFKPATIQQSQTSPPVAGRVLVVKKYQCATPGCARDLLSGASPKVKHSSDINIVQEICRTINLEILNIGVFSPASTKFFQNLPKAENFCCS